MNAKSLDAVVVGGGPAGLTAALVLGRMRREFATGRDDLERSALFVQPELALASDLGPSLGAGLSPTGGLEADETGQTAVPGLYVAGDAGAPVQSVAIATGAGARAAYALNADLAISSALRRANA